MSPAFDPPKGGSSILCISDATNGAYIVSLELLCVWYE